MVNRPHIGTLREGSLHAALKQWLAQPGDEIETRVDGYVIDIRRADLLIEIQTRQFSSIRRKLERLLDDHKVHLFHPIPQAKWIVRQDADGRALRKRKSPKRGRLLDIFRELVYIPRQLSHQNLTVGVLLTEEEEIWKNDGKGSWRRKRWSVADRHLLRVVQENLLSWPDDFIQLLPPTLAEPFTNKELASALKCKPALATKVSYTLRHAGLLDVVGKRGNANLYRLLR